MGNTGYYWENLKFYDVWPLMSNNFQLWLWACSVSDWKRFNPLSTTGLLTPCMIGSYHDMVICSANHKTGLITVHQKLAWDYFWYTFSDWFNDQISNLTNRQVVLKGLNSEHFVNWIKLCFWNNNMGPSIWRTDNNATSHAMRLSVLVSRDKEFT